MIKFEDIENLNHILAVIIGSEFKLGDALEEKFSQEDRNMYTEWFVKQFKPEYDDLAKDFVFRVVSEKIKELKGE